MAPLRGHSLLKKVSMGNHFEIRITAEPGIQELLVAELSEIGYEGFEESDHELKAYIKEEAFAENDLNNCLSKYAVSFIISIIERQNWNALWESNFEPVLVDDFVGVRAGFHPPFSGVSHEIIITPKMSFGTGHHATTWMVMKLMQELDFRNKKVFDFGTGTGILAILAEKLGAAHVLAVDNDDWCIENASENISINNCKNIDIQKNETVDERTGYDIILANINRNIILANLASLVGVLKKEGEMVLSGLLELDETDITNACLNHGLLYRKTLKRNGWIALWFVRK